MRRAPLLAAALTACLAHGAPAGAGEPFQFGVIGHPFKGGADEGALRLALKENEHAKAAFVVANGLKAKGESCSDQLYSQRKQVLDESAAPLVLSVAASDWSECKNSLGRTAAIDRLNRLREVFFADDQSLGARKMALSRLSSNAKFRSYAENAHWEYGQVLFATINLPANNNHFRAEAGRNSEFEDRIVANRSWLKRLFAVAARQKLAGIVLFSDGDVGVLKQDEGAPPGVGNRQDGFAGTRRQIVALAEKFPGQVLLIDAQGAAPGKAIAWRANLGHLSVDGKRAAVRVHPGAATLFSLPGAAEQAPP
ncbi:MAG: hypothetical protein V4754_04175 [Pseudomonadota bacterium]